MFNLIGNSLTKYVDFQGRATRKEFWSFFLFFYAVAFIEEKTFKRLGTVTYLCA
jgi:uncharacterized membrane protein YhaH (DUF805 family)